MRRRNYALGQMADAGFITRERAEQAKKAPIVTVGRPALDTDAAFFVEEVRQQLEERYGAQQLYENGLAVYTTLDLKLQHAAEAALADGHAQDRSPARLPQAGPHRRGGDRELHRIRAGRPGTRRVACRRWARRSSPS